jgi:hypothetical protein
VFRFVQDLTPILERFAIDLYATLRIEIRHCHLRSSVYMCLSLSEGVKNGTTQSAAYSISFLDLLDFNDKVLSRNRLMLDEETD